MANNSFLPVVAGPVSAGAVEAFANEDIGGIKYPNVRVFWGAAGVATPASAANPLPVVTQGSINIGTMPAVSASITGTVAVTQSGAWTVSVTGTVTVSGTVAATQSGTWNINAITTLPAITGTVTANQGGTWSVRNQDGSGNALTSAVRGAERALSVQLVDASGTQITSFSGGVTYVEDTLLPADPQAAVLLARRRDTLTATEVSGDGDAIALNANNKGQLYTIAEIPASQLGTAGPLTKANSTSVTMATDEQVAHDAVDSGNPWKVGGQARTSNPTAVGNADRVNFIADKLGKQIAVTAIRERKFYQQTDVPTTSETPIIFAGGTGVFRDLYGLTMANTSPSTVTITIRDSMSGIVVMAFVVPPTDTRGLTLDCGSAIPQSVADSQWTATLNAISGGQIRITALYVENT